MNQLDIHPAIGDDRAGLQRASLEELHLVAVRLHDLARDVLQLDCQAGLGLDRLFAARKLHLELPGQAVQRAPAGGARAAWATAASAL